MVEVVVTDRDGRVVNRVAVNEDLFNYVLERTRERRQDLATAWFLRILRGIFTPATAKSLVSETYTDVAGTSRTQVIKRELTGFGIFFNTDHCHNRLWIAYGASSAPPTRTDFRLGSKLGEGIAGVSIDEVHGTLTISASFTMGADTVIYEVGLEWEGTIASHNICGRILLDRTVFPDGILVRAGQTLTVVYRFLLP
jgi:hypothetical protein